MLPSSAAPSQLRYRQSATSLQDDAVTALRNGFTGMMALSDERGYAYQAGIHGLPLPISCQHGNDLFLPWHRAYLYYFEQYLMDQDPAAGLVWWDWSAQQGIPPIFQAPADGSANPLASAAVTGIPAEQFSEEGVPPETKTFREPSPPDELPDANTVSAVLELPDFHDFSQQLEVQLHNRVHGWVGGTMDMIPLAAFDPIFWAHHTMVNRLWRLWQLKYPGAGPDKSLLSVPLDGFVQSMTVAQTLDVANLGYDYAVTSASATP